MITFKASKTAEVYAELLSIAGVCDPDYTDVSGYQWDQIRDLEEDPENPLEWLYASIETDVFGYTDDPSGVNHNDWYHISVMAKLLDVINSVMIHEMSCED